MPVYAGLSMQAARTMSAREGAVQVQAAPRPGGQGSGAGAVDASQVGWQHAN